MKPVTLVLTLVIVAGAAAGYAWMRRLAEPERALAELQELEGTDLQRLGGREWARAEALFRRFFPGELHDTLPWRVFRLDADPRRRPALALGSYYRQPDNVGYRLYVAVWQDGVQVDTDDWTVDATPVDARAAFRPDLGRWCLELDLSRGKERRKQFRAVLEGDVPLIREEADGRAVSPLWSGYAPARAEGPDLAASPKDWPALLRDPNTAILLQRLCWLGLRGGGYAREHQLDILDNPGVHAELEKLRTSGNSWIREAAELALQP